MRQLLVSLCLALAFFMASAVAQTAPSGGSQGTQNSSPSMQQPGQYPNRQPGMDQPDNTAPTAQTDQGTANQNRNNGEHKFKGCVQSQGGQYVLETKKGKTVTLTGQDVSAHVGHEVAVKGTWESGSGMSSTASGNAGTSEKTFNVTKVEMISETCGGKGMGHGTGNGTGTGSSPSGSGTSTQPPQ